MRSHVSFMICVRLSKSDRTFQPGEVGGLRGEEPTGNRAGEFHLTSHSHSRHYPKLTAESSCCKPVLSTIYRH
jgi:hypothetical protein